MRATTLYVFAVICLLSACATTSVARNDGVAMFFELSDSERAEAVRLSEASSDYRTLAVESPVYLVEVEALRAKDEAVESDGRRQLLVTHYAAASDTAILTVVDVEADRVVSVDAVPHLPVRLSEEEFRIATRLALEDPGVAALLNGREVEIEAQLARTTDRDDPQFGHRVLHLLFKTSDGYLEERAIVDITAREVILE